MTLITYMFLHAGWLHLISNMLFLWVFADNVEDAFGHWGFLVFYLICGIAGALIHTALQPSSHAPLIGASAAVSGVLGAYIVLFPKARVWILLLMRIPLRISATLGAGRLVRVPDHQPLHRRRGARPMLPGGPILAASSSALALTYLLRSRLLVTPLR